ncbi:MAG: S1C family serine protease [Lachnospiraceae bacterium]|nr:S1C family serine protease [Lachnospiraceae bacterium]
MSDENNNEFIKEKIKEVPVNKKRTAKKILFSICMGAVFGLAAALVFAFTFPKFASMNDYKDGNISVVSSETESETESEAYDTETEESEKTSTEDASADTETEVAEEEMTEISTEESVEETETELTAEEITKMRLKEYQELQNDIYNLGKAAAPALVSVTATVNNTDWYDDSYQSQTMESGLILSMDAEKVRILSNYSTIASAENVTVTFNDSTTAPATMVSYDANTGTAVLNVAIADMNPSTPGRIASAIMTTRDNIKQGDVIVAVGNPLGTNQSIAIGNIIDSDNEVHTIDQVYSVFTTDIVGNGESSGVILNLDGEVIGFILQEFSMGEGNAVTVVPVGELSEVLDILQREKAVPYAGVYIRTVTDVMKEEYNLPSGVYVSELVMDSPAMEVGIQTADIITKANGKFIREASDFTKAIHSLEIDDIYSITVMRQSGDEYVELEYELTATSLK